MVCGARAAVILVSGLLALPQVGYASIYSYSALLFVVAALQVAACCNACMRACDVAMWVCLCMMDQFMHVCMYVCMYLCLYVCMYACMHVCMYVCMHVCMYACMHVCLNLSVCLSIHPSCVMYTHAHTHTRVHEHTDRAAPTKPSPSTLDRSILHRQQWRDRIGGLTHLPRPRSSACCLYLYRSVYVSILLEG